MGHDSRMLSREVVALLAAEFIGTLLFQLLGGGAGNNILGPFINGLSLVALVFTFGGISGAHFNPAVSFAMAISGDMGIFKAAAYMVSQISGATLGALLYTGLTVDLGLGSGDESVCFTSMGASEWQVFGWEAVLTFMLLLVIYAVAVNNPTPDSPSAMSTPTSLTAPLAIGLAVASMALVAGGVTGSFLNPARFLAPVVVHGCDGHRWATYIGGQLLGAAVAAFCNNLLFRNRDSAEDRSSDRRRSPAPAILAERLLIPAV